MYGFFLAQQLITKTNMPAIQAVMGSIGSVLSGSLLPDPGGWFSSIDNGSNNTLKWKLYDGYHNESINLSGLTLLEDTDGYPNLQTGADNRTSMFTGYVYIPTGANYIFRTVSDDGSYLWLGPNAWDGNYNINNALINNGGLHSSQQTDSNWISLVGNQWYPIRILFGNLSGGTDLRIYWSTDNNVWNTGTYSYNTATAEGFN